ncbi:MAG: Rsd/AlgQ family anti-sigma factor [Pseudomonadota bacterium]
MSHSLRDAQEQFANVEALLTRWLKARRELLSRFTEIVVTLEDGITESIDARQQALCDLLVDYVSAGHFEVFHTLVKEAESFEDGSNSLAEHLLPSIGDTTEVILAYEEKYGTGEGYSEKLKRDLSALGELLESRFVLEDQLIAGLHGSHRRLVLQAAPKAS